MVDGKKAVRMRQEIAELEAAGARRGEPIMIRLGEPLPRNPAYVSRKLRMDFLEASYRGGHRYKDARDPGGQPVLVPHEQESKKAHERRKRMSTCHNFCRPIADKLVGLVFGSTVARDPSPGPSEWAKDVDDDGCSLHEFMRQATLRAVTIGRWFVQLDTTKPEDAVTQAQAKAAGSRIIVSDLHPRRVLDWRDAPRQYLVADESVGPHGGARLWDDATVQIILLDERGMVASIGPRELHGWDAVPVVEVGLRGGEESVVEDVAALQLSIFNMDSILKEEISKQTFSQWWLASPDVKPDDLASVDVGSRKVLVLPVDASTIKFERLSGDPAQGESIRESIAADVQEIYRCVGLKDPSIEQGNSESGRALKIRFTETEYIAAAIADMAEEGETRIMELWAGAAGQGCEPPCYPDTFDAEDVAQGLEMVIKVASAGLPGSVVKAMQRKWVDDMFSGVVEDAELEDMRKDIEAMPDATGMQGEADGGDALSRGAAQERKEHPGFSPAQAKKIASDHLKKNPKAY